MTLLMRASLTASRSPDQPACLRVQNHFDTIYKHSFLGDDELRLALSSLRQMQQGHTASCLSCRRLFFPFLPWHLSKKPVGVLVKYCRFQMHHKYSQQVHTLFQSQALVLRRTLACGYFSPGSACVTSRCFEVLTNQDRFSKKCI